MAVIRSGATTDELTVDPTSKASRVTLYDSSGNLLTQPRNTYHAGGRLAAGTGLSFAFSSTTAKQLITIYHTGTSTKLVRLLKAWITIINISAACQIIFELESLSVTTAPATGNPAITPMALSPAAPAAEATVLCLPTTPGSEISTATGVGLTGIVATGATASLVSAGLGQQIILYQYNPLAPAQQPQMRAAVAEGWAIRGFPNATTPTLVFTAGFEFTEE